MSDGFSDFFYSAQDGLKLHARVYGSSSGNHLPVVCLPGLTRNARDFHDLALALSTRKAAPRKVIAFDYRGRGQSEWDKNWENYDVITETADVVAGLTALGIEHAAFIGTSRGGLIIHALAAARPGALKAVVLNDVGPVVDAAGLAQIRAYLQRAPTAGTYGEAIAIQRVANEAAFPALKDADWERLVRAHCRDEGGKPVMDFDPAILNSLKSINLDVPLPSLWPQFMGLRSVPILAIRGENSKLFSTDTLDQMQKRHPKLTAITVEGQGHAPLLETAGLPEKIAAFLQQADAG